MTDDQKEIKKQTIFNEIGMCLSDNYPAIMNINKWIDMEFTEFPRAARLRMKDEIGAFFETSQKIHEPLIELFLDRIWEGIEPYYQIFALEEMS